MRRQPRVRLQHRGRPVPTVDTNLAVRGRLAGDARVLVQLHLTDVTKRLRAAVLCEPVRPQDLVQQIPQREDR